jgi:hypothetical protein
MKKKCSLVVILISLMLLFSLCAYAQQEKGDKEFGLSGLAFLTHEDVGGEVSVQGTLGYYLSRSNFVGVTFGPAISFGGGSDIAGDLFYAAEYRHLFGKANAKVWPFVGFQGGGFTHMEDKNNFTAGMVAPEFGVKIYASQRNAFEITYQMPIGLSGYGQSVSFSQRSYSIITFGFKHLFGKDK